MLRVTLPFRIANITLQHYVSPSTLHLFITTTLHPFTFVHFSLLFSFWAWAWARGWARSVIYNTYHLTVFLPISTLLLLFAPLHFHSLLLLHTNPIGTLSPTQPEHQSPFPFCNKQSFLYMPTPLPLPLTGSLSLTATIALDATGLHDSVSCNTKRASAPSTGAVPFYPAMQQRS